MAYKTTDDGQQRFMNRLADSVFELTDEEILAEIREAGLDPQPEADRTSLVLRQAADRWEAENERLGVMGHTINPNRWRCLEGDYHNYCPSCGSTVSFSAATGAMYGEALVKSCPEHSYSINRREASR